MRGHDDFLRIGHQAISLAGKRNSLKHLFSTAQSPSPGEHFSEPFGHDKFLLSEDCSLYVQSSNEGGGKDATFLGLCSDQYGVVRLVSRQMAESGNIMPIMLFLLPRSAKKDLEDYLFSSSADLVHWMQLGEWGTDELRLVEQELLSSNSGYRAVRQILLSPHTKLGALKLAVCEREGSFTPLFDLDKDQD